ncbi:hypothetical protein HAX54_052562, partial [Datura stramonium]|nr:hypothetical protein [Datura stramonium]
MNLQECEAARLRYLANAQDRVNNQNVPKNEDDDVLRDDLDEQNVDNIASKDYRQPQRARRQHWKVVPFDYMGDDVDLDRVGAIGAIVPPPLASGAMFNITSTTIQLLNLR